MSEMKEMLLEVIDRLLKKQVTKETVDLLEGGKWAEPLWRKLQEQELHKVAQQQNGDLEDLLLLYERIGYYAAPIPFLEHTLANVFLQCAGALPSDELVTFAFAEHVHIKQNSASGEIDYVRWGRFAKKLVMIQPTQLVVVNLEQVTVKNGKNLAAEPRDTVILEQTPVQCYPLTAQQYSFYRTLEHAAIIALIAGAVARAVDLSVQFSKERQQFGRPIYRFQLVQQHIAQLAGERAIAHTALQNSVVALQQQRLQDVLFARLRLDKTTQLVAASAHQVHAAIGVTFEHSLHHATRRLWAWRDEGQKIADVSVQLADVFLQTEHDVWSYLTRGDV